MNLRAAEKELRGRSPVVTPYFLALEGVIVVAVSIALVLLFT